VEEVAVVRTVAAVVVVGRLFLVDFLNAGKDSRRDLKNKIFYTMSTHSLYVILVVAISCTQPNSKTETVDSTRLSTTKDVSETFTSDGAIKPDEQVKPNEPAIEASGLAAPDTPFSATTVSSDKEEAQIVNDFFPLTEQFNNGKYVTIKMSLTSIVDDVMGGTKQTNEIWYYDAERKLCGFSSTYTSSLTTRSEFYLCKDENLVALSSDNDYQDEGPRAYTSVRIVSSRCPRCGLVLSKEEDGDIQEYQADVIDQSSLDKYSNDFFDKHNAMLENFQSVPRVTKNGERYSAFVLADQDTIKYSIDAGLVNKFFKKAVIE
jgi:hypothetical protein